MKAIVSGVLVMVIAGSALHAARHILDDDSVVWRTRLEEEHERELDLDAALAARREFAADLAGLLKQFESGAATFADTVQAIEQLAIIERPEYLSQLMELEPGDTVPELVAHNVVRHFTERQRRARTSMSRQVLIRAQRDLAAFLKHEHGPATAIH